MRSLGRLFTLGQLACHFNSALAAYQARIHETGSYFTAPAEYGTWLTAYYVDGQYASRADLVSIQTSNSASGTVQVRAAGYPYGYLSDEKTTTAFSQEQNGVWQLADYDEDGILDLIYIKNRNTASGKVEVRVASGGSSFENIVLETETAFDIQINGHWQVFDVDGDGILDLVFIQNSNTASNKVIVHIASGASGFTSVTKKVETTFDIGDDGSWQMVNYDNDAVADLAYVQNINTFSGYVEISIASGASDYQSIVQSVPSSYSTENNGVWQMIDWDDDGVLDLVYIKTLDTSGTVEVHIGWGQQ
jgi:hypothetical protein